MPHTNKQIDILTYSP